MALTDELWERGKLLNMAARLHRDGIWMRDDKEVNSKKKNKALGTVVENKTELNLYHENDKLGLVARDQTEAANDPECDTSSPAVEDDEELDLYDESSSPQGTSEETSGGMPEEGETSEKRPKTVKVYERARFNSDKKHK